MPTFDTYKAISEGNRRTILDALSSKPHSVSEIHALLDVSQPAVSQHLKVLRDANLVRVEKSGRSRIYHLEAAALREVFEWVSYYEKFWTEKLDALGAFLDQQEGKDHD